MAYNKELIEYLHDSGKMPDWAYYQQNGATLQENYIRQINEIDNRTIEKIKLERQQKELEKQLEKQLEDKIEEILEELLKDFNLNTK